MVLGAGDPSVSEVPPVRFEAREGEEPQITVGEFRGHEEPSIVVSDVEKDALRAGDSDAVSDSSGDDFTDAGEELDHSSEKMNHTNPTTARRPSVFLEAQTLAEDGSVPSDSRGNLRRASIPMSVILDSLVVDASPTPEKDKGTSEGTSSNHGYLGVGYSNERRSSILPTPKMGSLLEKNENSRLKEVNGGPSGPRTFILSHTESLGGSGSAEENEKRSEGKLTGALAFAVFAVTISSFQFGYHIGCVNAPGEMITKWFSVSHHHLFDKEITIETAQFYWSVAVAIFAVGGMIGGLASGWLADRMGRKGALLFNNILAFIAAALMALCKSVNVYPMMILGRFVIGLNCGLSSGLVPMYLTEVSPINLRGMLGSVHQLLVTISILVSQIFGLPYIFGNENHWQLIFAFTVVPAVLQLATLPLCPESPKYTLVVKNLVDNAEKDLKKLRAKEDVKDELDEIKEEALHAQSTPKVSMSDMFKGALRWPMFIAIMMMLSQQLSGINAAMFFSTTIFKSAGLVGIQAVYATIAMGTVNVLMTIVSVWLVDHPKFGRRSLHLIGLSGMFISSLLIVLTLSNIGPQGTEPNVWSFAAIAFVLLFVVSFATGPGAIPWFFVSEIFSSAARGNASSIAVMTNWMANFLVGVTFLPLTNLINQYSFFVFSAFLAVFIFFTWKYVPETKGKTVEEITAGFEKRTRSQE